MSTKKVTRTKSAAIMIRISPVLKDVAAAAAADDARTLTSLIEKLLTDYCHEHGFWQDGKPTQKYLDRIAEE